MTEMDVPTVSVTATEVVLPGKVEPSGLRLVERALPPPAAGQALVRVESTAVSFAESAMRRGRYYGQPPFPFVPGYDLVGVVEAVGRRKAGLSQTGSVPGPAAHRPHAPVRPAARRRAHREDRRPLPAGRSGRGYGTGRVLRPDRPRQDHPGALTTKGRRSRRCLGSGKATRQMTTSGHPSGQALGTATAGRTDRPERRPPQT